MLVKMIAIKHFEYANKAIEIGDPVTVENEGHAAILAHGGFARRADDEPEKRSYRRRDMKAEH